MTESYDGRQVVGMDLHRQRSVLVRMTEDGPRLETARCPWFLPSSGTRRARAWVLVVLVLVAARS